MPNTPPVKNSLLLIDATNIFRRCYEAIQDSDPVVKAESAHKSAHRSFARAMHEHQPSHALAIWDHGGPTWRHDLFPAYKANRTPAPEAFVAQSAILREDLFQDLGLNSVSIRRVEADDVIASVALQWLAKTPLSPIILSKDKDLTQLHARGALVWDHFSGTPRDELWITEKMGVSPSQVTDFLALVGDPMDNVPGVQGIGPRTAVDLLSTYGTLDKVLANADDIPGATGNKIRMGKDLALLSRDLVALKEDVSVGLRWREIQMNRNAATPQPVPAPPQPYQSSLLPAP